MTSKSSPGSHVMTMMMMMMNTRYSSSGDDFPQATFATHSVQIALHWRVRPSTAWWLTPASTASCLSVRLSVCLCVCLSDLFITDVRPCGPCYLVYHIHNRLSDYSALLYMPCHSVADGWVLLFTPQSRDFCNGNVSKCQSVSDVCLKRICSLVTSVFSALQVLDDNCATVYKFTYLLTYLLAPWCLLQLSH